MCGIRVSWFFDWGLRKLRNSRAILSKMILVTINFLYQVEWDFDFTSCTANILAVLTTVDVCVTFPVAVWEYSELLMTLSCCGYCHQRYWLLSHYCHQRYWVLPNYCWKCNTAESCTVTVIICSVENYPWAYFHPLKLAIWSGTFSKGGPIFSTDHRQSEEMEDVLKPSSKKMVQISQNFIN